MAEHNQRTQDFVNSYVSDVISAVDYDLWKEIYHVDAPDDPDTTELVSMLYDILVEFYEEASKEENRISL